MTDKPLKPKYFSIGQFTFDKDKKIFTGNTRKLKVSDPGEADIVIIGENENKTFKLVSNEQGAEGEDVVAQKVYQSVDDDYFIFLDVMASA